MTLGNAAAAHVRLIVWCKACRHQTEPDPTEQAQRYGAETSVLDWRKRLICSRCGGHGIDMVVTGTRREAATDGSPSAPQVLSLRGLRRLPLQVRDRVGSASGTGRLDDARHPAYREISLAH